MKQYLRLSILASLLAANFLPCLASAKEAMDEDRPSIGEFNVFCGTFKKIKFRYEEGNVDETRVLELYRASRGYSNYYFFGQRGVESTTPVGQAVLDASQKIIDAMQIGQNYCLIGRTEEHGSQPQAVNPRGDHGDPYWVHDWQVVRTPISL
jgi:hypothetical protein